MSSAPLFSDVPFHHHHRLLLLVYRSEHQSAVLFRWRCSGDRELRTHSLEIQNGFFFLFLSLPSLAIGAATRGLFYRRSLGSHIAIIRGLSLPWRQQQSRVWIKSFPFNRLDYIRSINGGGGARFHFLLLLSLEAKIIYVKHRPRFASSSAAPSTEFSVVLIAVDWRGSWGDRNGSCVRTGWCHPTFPWL